MESNTTTNIVITLVLSKEEAAWLHALVQNPMSSVETAEDLQMRTKFFNATTTP